MRFKCDILNIGFHLPIRMKLSGLPFLALFISFHTMANALCPTRPFQDKKTLQLQSDSLSIKVENDVALIVQSKSEDSVLIELKEYFRNIDRNKGNPFQETRYDILALNALSYHRLAKGKTDSTQVMIERALKINNDKWEKLKIDSFNLLAFYYYLLSDYKTSTDYAFKVLELAENVKHYKAIAIAKNYLGWNYWALGQIENAEENYREGLAICKKHDYKLLAATMSHNLGTIFYEQQEYLKAVNSFQQAVNYFEAIKDPSASIGYGNLGLTYGKLKNYNKSEFYFKKAYDLLQENENDLSLVYVLMDWGEIYADRKEFDLAIEKYDLAIEATKRINFKRGYYLIYERYYQFYEKNSDYKSALEKIKLFQQWKDSVSHHDQLEQIAELNTQFEIKEKENAILKLEQENLKKESNILKKEKTIKLIGGIGLFSVVSLLILFFLFRHRDNLLKQQEIFKTIVQTEIKEQHRIARDLHDSIGSMLASISGHLSIIKTNDQKSAESLSTSRKMLKGTIEETRRISHNMMPEELVRFGLVVAVEGFLDDIALATGMDVKFEHWNISEEMEISKGLQIYRIINELVQNVVKHSSSNAIEVVLKQKNDEIQLQVKDNGRGFKYVEKSEVGLGLKNVKSRVLYLRGNLAIDSRPNKGTTISMNIPVI